MGIGSAGWQPGWHNRFVFTCQYGWIDMGHFFQAAAMGYWLEKETGVPRWFDETLIDWAEDTQFSDSYFDPFLRRRSEITTPNPTYESYMTPEDIPSNRLGMRFGRDAASGALGDIVEGWRNFLINSGAVASLPLS